MKSSCVQPYESLVTYTFIVKTFKCSSCLKLNNSRLGMEENLMVTDFIFFKLDTDIFQMKLTVNFITETDRQLINKID